MNEIEALLRSEGLRAEVVFQGPVHECPLCAVDEVTELAA